MRKNIESFNDIYKENLDKIPLDELGKIVYNKHYQYLENLNIAPADMDKLFKPIQDIMEGSEFYKVLDHVVDVMMSFICPLYSFFIRSMKSSWNIVKPITYQIL